MRLRSLDVFRGLTMAAMVIVNNPGDWNTVYWPLLHAEWHGWTPTDLIFPFFLFIVGVAIPLGSPERRSWGRVLRRSAAIFAFGLCLAGVPFFPLATWRIPGVLQRIALCYLAAVAVVRWTGTSEARANRDIWCVVAAVLTGYWVLLTFVPTPGGVAGDLTPEGNWGAWLDRALMRGHLWRPDWDPEGLSSTLPAVATTLLGVQAGLFLGRREPHAVVVRTLASYGLAGVLAGVAWHTVFPINKSIWTSSYVLFTGGTAAATLAACYWWVDAGSDSRRLAWSEPFVALGRNALLLFVLSGLLAKTLIYLKWPDSSMSMGGWVYLNAFAPLAPPHLASLLYAVAHLLALFTLLWVLHRRGQYFTV